MINLFYLTHYLGEKEDSNLYVMYSNVLAATNADQAYVAQKEWKQPLEKRELWIIKDNEKVAKSTAKVLCFIYKTYFSNDYLQPYGIVNDRQHKKKGKRRRYFFFL